MIKRDLLEKRAVRVKSENIGGMECLVPLRSRAQVFANYSWLSSGPPIHIAATELRGITIEQLSSLQLG
jgi:hypothetical protein